MTRSGIDSTGYDDWSVADLRRRVAESGVDGGSAMSKSELIEVVRRCGPGDCRGRRNTPI